MSTAPTRHNDADPPAEPQTGVLAAAVRVVSGLTLLSRFAGLARDIVTARIMGDGALGSAFRAAYALPNFFRRLFGEGALSAAFLPEYTLLTRDDPAGAGSLARMTLRLLLLVTGGLTVVGIAAMVLLLWMLPADVERDLSLRLMILMLPMMPAVCTTAVLGGMLQAHGRFGIPAAAPIVLNALQIGAGLLYYAGLITDRTAAAYVVGGSALAASLLQIAWSLHGLRGRVRWGAATDAALEHGRKVWRRFVPAMLGLGTLQLNTMMDMVIAMWPVWVGPTVLGHAVTLDVKSNAVLSYTQTLYQFPLGVFGIAGATAVFPMLSRAADRPREFLETLQRGLRLSLFIGLPASAGLILVREDLVRVVFGGGSRGFSEDGLARCAAVLAGFAPAVWAYSLNHVMTRAFYAKGDTTTPMRLAVGAVGLNLVLNLTLIWPLREAGLAWATAISAAVQCVALMLLARRVLDIRPLDRETWKASGRIALSTALMCGVVGGINWLLRNGAGWERSLLRLCVCVGAGGVVFAAIAYILKLPELRWLAQRPARGAGATPISFE